MRGLYFYSSIIAFLLGVFIQSFVPVSLPVMLWLGVVALGLAVYGRLAAEGDQPPVLVTLILILLFVPLGMLRMWYDVAPYDTSPLLQNLDTTYTLTGTVVDEPDVRERSSRLTVAVGDDRVLVSTERYTTITYGDVIEVTGTLRQPESFTGDLGRTFHYPGYLRVRDIGYVLSFPQSITVIDTRQGNRVMHSIYDVKDWFVGTINTHLPEPAAGLGLGLLLGVKQALGNELETAFRHTGIIHIVVLSGYNVMIVIAAVMFLLATVLSLRSRVLVGLVAITLFALLVGLSATVVRATIMAALVLIAQLIGRQYHIVRALCLAGAIMVVVEPHILAFDIGFQLSFMATLGLILIAPQFETIMGHVPKSFGAREFLIATIATQIAVAPLLLYHIGELSLIAVVVNVLVLPIVPFAMLATFILGLFASFVPVLASLLTLITYYILMSIIVIVLWAAAVPYAYITVPAFPWWVIPLSYLVIGVVWYWWAVRYQVRMPWQPYYDEGVGDVIVSKESVDEPNNFATIAPEATITTKDTDVDDTTSWTVVDEETLHRTLPAFTPVSKTPPHKNTTTDTPIFFR